MSPSAPLADAVEAMLTNGVSARVRDRRADGAADRRSLDARRGTRARRPRLAGAHLVRPERLGHRTFRGPAVTPPVPIEQSPGSGRFLAVERAVVRAVAVPDVAGAVVGPAAAAEVGGAVSVFATALPELRDAVVGAAGVPNVADRVVVPVLSRRRRSELRRRRGLTTVPARARREVIERMMVSSLGSWLVACARVAGAWSQPP